MGIYEKGEAEVGEDAEDGNVANVAEQLACYMENYLQGVEVPELVGKVSVRMLSDMAETAGYVETACWAVQLVVPDTCHFVHILMAEKCIQMGHEKQMLQMV